MLQWWHDRLDFRSELVVSMKDKIRHAFAVEKSGAVEPTERQGVVIDLLCEAIVRRHMTTPAITILEMSRPMNYLFANAMYVAQPAASVLIRLVRMVVGSGKARGGGIDGEMDGERLRLEETDWTPVAEFLERRGSFDYLCKRIEYFEEELTKRERERKENALEKEKAAGQDVSEKE